MRLSDPISRRRALSLTPLIDVVFLLLVFFMLASTFTKFGTVELSAGGASTTAAAPDLATVSLIHISGSAPVRINGQAIAADGLEAALQTELDQGKTRAVIVVRGGTETRDLIATLTQVKRLAFKTVQVVD